MKFVKIATCLTNHVTTFGSIHYAFFVQNSLDIPPNGRADLVHNCAIRDKNMKIGTWFLDIIWSILRNGANSDLTFGDV